MCWHASRRAIIIPITCNRAQAACLLQEEGAAAPQCCLCPVTGGALKPATMPGGTAMQGLWCHATCMQWIPEVTVDDVTSMEPISHIDSIQKERWDLNCCLCKCACTAYHLAALRLQSWLLLAWTLQLGSSCLYCIGADCPSLAFSSLIDAHRDLIKS